MSQFIKIKFNCLPISAHVGFFRKVKAEITASPSALVESLGTLPDKLTLLYNEETGIFEWVRKSELTVKIKAADKRQDRALTAIRSQVRSLIYITIASTSEPATRVYTMLMSYGDVNVKPYEDQTAIIASILKRITTGGDCYADIVSLQQPAPALAAMIGELQQAFALFEQLIAQRDTKSLKKPDRTFAQVRRDIEPVYHDIEKIINAGAVLNTLPAYSTFIDHLNPEIERLNEEHHRVRHNIKLSEPEPIQQQAYTGLPVTPTPKVLYVTPDGTVRLELGRDYNLSFRDNVEVGNATCIIHGKGAYKGSKTVTFIIARI
jgi:hypothetical protein